MPAVDHRSLPVYLLVLDCTMKRTHSFPTVCSSFSCGMMVSRDVSLIRQITKRAEEMESTTFGALLKRYRMAAGLTQEALAERASLSTRAVSDLERGLSRAPRYDTLDLLTRAMNLEAEPRAALFAAARPPLPGDDTKAAPLQVL